GGDPRLPPGPAAAGGGVGDARAAPRRARRAARRRAGAVRAGVRLQAEAAGAGGAKAEVYPFGLRPPDPRPSPRWRVALLRDLEWHSGAETRPALPAAAASARGRPHGAAPIPFGEGVLR